MVDVPASDPGRMNESEHKQRKERQPMKNLTFTDKSETGDSGVRNKAGHRRGLNNVGMVLVHDEPELQSQSGWDTAGGTAQTTLTRRGTRRQQRSVGAADAPRLKHAASAPAFANSRTDDAVVN